MVKMHALKSLQKENHFEKFVEQKKDRVGDFPNIIEHNKVMMQREERNRYYLYKRPIDIAIKQKEL